MNQATTKPGKGVGLYKIMRRTIIIFSCHSEPFAICHSSPRLVGAKNLIPLKVNSAKDLGDSSVVMLPQNDITKRSQENGAPRIEEATLANHSVLCSATLQGRASNARG
jgi:hypothetical protein